MKTTSHTLVLETYYRGTAPDSTCEFKILHEDQFGLSACWLEESGDRIEAKFIHDAAELKLLWSQKNPRKLDK